MSDQESGGRLVYLAELEGLGDAHLVGAALEAAEIPFKVAANTASGFDVVIPRSWGMLYVAKDRTTEATDILQDVRSDEVQASRSYDPDEEVARPPENDFADKQAE
jgi:hypothetical protein